MHFKFKLGVDVSKDWLDYCILTNNYELIIKGRIDNNTEAIQTFINSVLDLECIEHLQQVLLVMEHTGLYINHFVNTWLTNTGKLSLVASNKISESLQGTYSFDEKTDEMDALRIAEYSVRFEDKLELFKLKDSSLKKMQLLRAQRKRVVKCIGILEVPANENEIFEDKEASDLVSKGQENTIAELKLLLKSIDKNLQKVIRADQSLTNMYKLINSVPGIGPVTAFEIMLTTNAFIDFAPNKAKSYAKYCGIVPLERSSGKFRRKARTTKKANTRMKSLLTTCALSLINTKTELGRYYTKKREQGKEHMAVINAMRNKLVLRIFAVVRNQTMYERNLNVCLD